MVDGNTGVHGVLAHNYMLLPNGDNLIPSVMAASILAKVTRDHLMVDLAKTYSPYGFEINKGYLTPKHIETIRKVGLCPEHRYTAAKFSM